MYTSQPQRLYLSTYPGRQPGTFAAAQGGGSESVGDAWPNKAASRNGARGIRGLLAVLAVPGPSVTSASPEGEGLPGAMTTTVRSRAGARAVADCRDGRARRVFRPFAGRTRR